MKVALVHDYIKEFGGGERVLRVLSDIFPDAPIYTAFRVKGSTCDQNFKDRKIIESVFAPLIKLGKLYSPLRFLTPFIWKSFNLSGYDLVITSASWYITRGFRVGANTKVICYCHTPPRWLYGYETSVGFTKYLPVRIYSALVGHLLRLYDFSVSEKVNHWIANSKNVQKRIEKFYRKKSVVIYPPVEVEKISKKTKKTRSSSLKNEKQKKKYFLIVSRLVGAKGIEEAARAFKKLKGKYELKIVGEAHGYSDLEKRLKKLSGGNIVLVGRVSDEKLYQLYAGASGFIALAREEDFGMTAVEAQAAQAPVIAFNGGGFRESVIDGKTGVLINDTSENAILKAVSLVEKTKWKKEDFIKNSNKFSKKEFIKKINNYINLVMSKK